MKIDIFKIRKARVIEEVYKEVAEYLEDENIVGDANKLYEDLKYRESLGAIKIYDDFYLPHIITETALKNVVLRADNFEDKVLFIVLSESHEEYKEKIHNLVGNLLDRDFVEHLFDKDLKDFKKIIQDL